MNQITRGPQGQFSNLQCVRLWFQGVARPPVGSHGANWLPNWRPLGFQKLMRANAVMLEQNRGSDALMPR